MDDRDKFGAWLAENDEEFKTTVEMRDKDRQMILSALDIVRDFIIRKGLIIYGGLGLDYSLRLKGSSIYPDDEIPDYDVYSPDASGDAYELADVLKSRGFEHISAIVAKHVVTMRVRINFVVVFDVSYSPPALFSNLPFLMYNRMKVLHPDILKAGIHKVLATPYENPPFESLFTRTKKVLTRYEKLADTYPAGVPKNSSGLFEKITIRIPKVPVQLIMYGYIAFGFLCNSLKGLSKLVLKDNAEFLEKHPWIDEFDVEIDSASNAGDGGGVVADNTVTFTIPAGENVAQFLVTDILGVVNFFDTDTVTLMRPTGDLLYPSFAFDVDAPGKKDGASTKPSKLTYEFTRITRRFVPVYVREFKVGSKLEKFGVANPQHSLLNFIAKTRFMHLASPDVKTPRQKRVDAHELLYAWTLDAINLGNELMSRLPPDVVKHTIGESPFSLLVQSVGAENISQSHLVCLRKLSQELGLSNWRLYRHIALPDNYYPTNSCACKPPPKFDYSKSMFFNIDGARVVIKRSDVIRMLTSAKDADGDDAPRGDGQNSKDKQSKDKQSKDKQSKDKQSKDKQSKDKK